jgi:hypothetical protein
MEKAAILSMNLKRFQRLLEGETDPAKRRAIEERIKETEAQLPNHRQAGRIPVQDNTIVNDGLEMSGPSKHR